MASRGGALIAGALCPIAIHHQSPAPRTRRPHLSALLGGADGQVRPPASAGLSAPDQLLSVDSRDLHVCDALARRRGQAHDASCSRSSDRLLDRWAEKTVV